MLLRSVLPLSLIALALAGCATVSVLPGSSTVETSITKEQSALREASVTFNQMAVSRGWISASPGLLSVARVLVDGQSDDDVKSDASYATLIGAAVRENDTVSAAIIADADDAATALGLVSEEARRVLAAQAGEDTTRADLVSFERVLVQAQQSRLAFIEAATLAELGDDDETGAAIVRLEARIDDARLLADELARKYSGRAAQGVVS